MLNKNGIFYLNFALFIIITLLVVNGLNLPGNLLIQKALAAVGFISGDGTVNFLARFAGAQNPSNQIGNSIIFDNGTNVGIGTTSPTAIAGQGTALTVAGNAGGTLVLSDPDTTTGYRVGYLTYEDGILQYGIAADDGTSPSPKITVLYGGNVGIGTTASQDKLHIFDAGNIRLQRSTAQQAIRFFESATEDWTIAHRTDRALSIDSPAVRSLLLNPSGGNVGIGTTNPVTKLHVLADAGNWVGAIVNTNSAGYGFKVDCSACTGPATFSLAAYTGSGTGMFVLNNGNVGIGTTSPGAKLEVNGAMKLTPLAADPPNLTNGMMWMRQ